jgi:carboxyl-terminal processing protease
MREKQQGSFFGLGIQIQKRMGADHGDRADGRHSGLQARGARRRHHHARRGRGAQEDVSTDDVVRKLRGPKGTPVTITLRPAGPGRANPHDDHSAPRSRPYRSPYAVPDRTGYRLHLPSATSRTPSSRELTTANREARQGGMKRLLLDLRGNPGRRSGPAVDVADVFSPKGAKVVYTRGRTNSSAQE